MAFNFLIFIYRHFASLLIISLTLLLFPVNLLNLLLTFFFLFSVLHLWNQPLNFPSFISSLLLNAFLVIGVIRFQIASLAKTVRVIWLKNVSTGVCSLSNDLHFLVVWEELLMKVRKSGLLLVFRVRGHLAGVIIIPLIFRDLVYNTM